MMVEYYYCRSDIVLSCNPVVRKNKDSFADNLKFKFAPRMTRASSRNVDKLCTKFQVFCKRIFAFSHYYCHTLISTHIKTSISSYTVSAMRECSFMQVKTLRGHEKEVTDAVVLGGSQENWENPKPSLVVSISSDGSVKAWDVLQVLLIIEQSKNRS